jgi:hypothetical protein
MGVRYEIRSEGPRPIYVCQETAVRRAGKVCQTIPGKEIDAAIGGLLLELMTPMTLDMTLAVQRELEARAAESDGLRRQQLERLRYEAELARRRYMKVDPENRLVADSLEADWNDKLRRHSDAAAEYEKHSQEQKAMLSEEARQRVCDLAEQFPRIWRDDRVPATERKRILRLLVEDVTLIKAEKITAHVRLTGGSARTLVLERPQPIAQIRKFKPELVAEIDELLEHHCDREIADILNERGRRTWEDKSFNLKKIAFIRFAYKLASRFERLRRRGLLTTREVAERFNISQTAVYDWGHQGLIKKCVTAQVLLLVAATGERCGELTRVRNSAGATISNLTQRWDGTSQWASAGKRHLTCGKRCAEGTNCGVGATHWRTGTPTGSEQQQ